MARQPVKRRPCISVAVKVFDRFGNSATEQAYGIQYELSRDTRVMIDTGACVSFMTLAHARQLGLSEYIYSFIPHPDLNHLWCRAVRLSTSVKTLEGTGGRRWRLHNYFVRNFGFSDDIEEGPYAYRDLTGKIYSVGKLDICFEILGPSQMPSERLTIEILRTRRHLAVDWMIGWNADEDLVKRLLSHT